MITVGNIELFNVEEVADTLHVSPAAARRLFTSGQLKGRKVLRKWYVSKENLQTFLSEEQEQPIYADEDRELFQEAVEAYFGGEDDEEIEPGMQQPSISESIVGKRYVHLRNINGQLARYDIKRRCIAEEDMEQEQPPNEGKHNQEES